MINYEKIMEILESFAGEPLRAAARETIAARIMSETPAHQTIGVSELRDKLAMLYLKKQDNLPGLDAPNRLGWTENLAKDAYEFADELIKNIPNE